MRLKVCATPAQQKGLFLCVRVFCLYINVPHVCSAVGDQKEASHSLDGCVIRVLGTEARSSTVASVLNCSTISPAPQVFVC